MSGPSLLFGVLLQGLNETGALGFTGQWVCRAESAVSGRGME